jgi:MFS family permease
MLLALCVFTLGNSTDAFLLLRLSWAGVSTEWVATLWAVHHVVKMASSALGGWMSDHLGRRPMVIAGWLYYALIYCAFGLVSSPGWLITIFILYGVYYGLTEPTEKAWVADLAPKRLRAEAFGWYSGAIGLASLPASLLFGVLWSFWSPTVAFVVGAALALIAGFMLLSVPGSRMRENDDSP